MMQRLIKVLLIGLVVAFNVIGVLFITVFLLGQ
jgi:hypothetical protein